MTRLCETCRTPLVRKVFACGYKESPRQFEARRFCDFTCKMLAHRPKHSPSHPWVAAGRKVAEARRG